MTLTQTQTSVRLDRPGERGQAVVFVLLALGLFLLGMVAVAVDFTNLWFRRQAAQSAADSACVAGAMDLLALANGAIINPNYTPGTPFDCSSTYPNNSSSDPTPCWYAEKNGFASPGLGSNPAVEVAVSFPGSITGVSSLPPGSIAPYPFMQVVTSEDVKTYFTSLFSASRKQRVQTSAKCGLRYEVVFPPIVVLAPTGAASFRINGTSHSVIVYGGASRGIQVNSNDAGAVSIPSGCSATLLDLSQGGPTHDGSDLGVFGGPSTTPCSFAAGTKPGLWLSPTSPMADPMATTAAPASKPADGVITTLAPGVGGCPNTMNLKNNQCYVYSAGAYTGGNSINISGSGSSGVYVAFFTPGLYWIEDQMLIGSSSCVRPLDPSVSTGDGSGGTTFYFADNQSIDVAANGGSSCSGAGVPSYSLNSSKCDTAASQVPGGPTPTSYTDSVLLGPCTGTYGDPQGTLNPMGMQHGILFFQNRAKNLSGAGGKPPSWQGGGNFLLAGTLYFHRCTTGGGADAGGTGCDKVNAYNTDFSFQAGATTPGVLIGNIVTDKLTVGGFLILDVVPGAGLYGVKASLIR